MSLLFAVAQAVLATSPAPAAAGIVDYPPAFFEAAHPATVREMLDRIPGFTFEGGESVRGYEGAAGNVLVDGQRPAAKTDTLDAILRRIPSSSVAHIEVIRGGAPGVDMQNRSVIANVVLKKETPPSIQVSSFANYLTSSGMIAPQARIVGSGQRGDHKWQFSAFGAKYIGVSYGDGPTLRSDANGLPIQTGFSQSKAVGQSYSITGAYELPIGNGHLKVNGLLQRDPFDVDTSNRTFTPSVSLEKEHVSDDTDSSELGIRYSRSLGRRTSLELVALRQAKDIQFKDVVGSPLTAVDFSQSSQTEEKILRGVIRQKVSPTFAWELGAEGAWNTLDNRLAYSVNGRKISLPSANVTVTENRYEAIAKTSWSPNARWTVETGLRQELSEIASKGDTVLSKSLSYTKPRLAVKWNYSGENQIRLSVEREVGQLKFSDFTATSALKNGLVTAGNPDLAPEEGWAAELTSEHKVLGNGVILVTGRHVELTNAIDRAPIFTKTGAIDSPANIGSGVRDEVSVEATLPLDFVGVRGLRSQGKYLWRQSSVTDPTTRLRREISGLPSQSWSANVTWDVPGKNLTLEANLSRESPATDYRFDQVSRTSNTAIRDFIVTWTPKSGTLVRLEILNIGDQAYSFENRFYEPTVLSSTPSYIDRRREHIGTFVRLGFRLTL